MCRTDLETRVEMVIILIVHLCLSALVAKSCNGVHAFISVRSIFYSYFKTQMKTTNCILACHRVRIFYSKIIPSKTVLMSNSI